MITPDVYVLVARLSTLESMPNRVRRSEYVLDKHRGHGEMSVATLQRIDKPL